MSGRVSHQHRTRIRERGGSRPFTRGLNHTCGGLVSAGGAWSAVWTWMAVVVEVILRRGGAVLIGAGVCLWQ